MTPFILSPISSKVVADALCDDDASKSTGEDKLVTFTLKHSPYF